MTDPDDEFLQWAEREVFPKIADSRFVVSLFSGKVDAKIAVELGAALLLDKPIVFVVYGDHTIPPHLAKLATRVVTIGSDEDLGSGPGAERLQAALTEVMEPRDRPSRNGP